MNLVSLNCSGESLEKALVLCDTSFATNWRFYSQFNEIFVFYSNNLPKKSKELVGINGTISSYLRGIERRYILTHEQENILNSTIKMVDILYLHKHISERTYYVLKSNPNRMNNLVKNVPVNYIFYDYYPMIIKKLQCHFPSVTFIQISFHDILEYYIENSFYIDGHSKLYGLQSDGNIATYDLGFWGRERKRAMSERIKRSICLSPNIYAFLTAINLWILQSEKNITVGYRPMTRFKRASYDLAICELMKNNTMVIEPRNTEFSSLLDKFPNSLSVEERSNVGIITAFNHFIKHP